MLYKQLLNSWLADQEIYKKGGTYTVYYNVAHNQILPHLGNMDVDQIDSEILQDFVLGQLDHGRVDGKGGIAKSYADSIISVLKLSLNRKDLEIRLPYNPPKEVEIFDKSDQIALINHLQTEISYKNFGILLAIHTGIRIGELCALKWSDINFDCQLLHINKTMSRLYTKKDGSRLVITSPKSKASIRPIPLNKWSMQFAV